MEKSITINVFDLETLVELQEFLEELHKEHLTPYEVPYEYYEVLDEIIHQALNQE